MRKLGEQWIEEIDGIKHMYKAVEVATRGLCSDIVVKDLGILNEDGCLPSPWGGYPKVIRVGKPNFVTYFNVSYIQKSEKGKGSLQVQVIGKTKQQAIDAWNRRAM